MPTDMRFWRITGIQTTAAINFLICTSGMQLAKIYALKLELYTFGQTG